MGPYCKFCDNRCFVERILKDGRPMLMATCQRGAEHSREVFGEDHTTARNPSAVEVRRCRMCGCTDDHACDGGCWWVSDPEGGNLCSACPPYRPAVEAQPVEGQATTTSEACPNIACGGQLVDGVHTATGLAECYAERDMCGGAKGVEVDSVYAAERLRGLAVAAGRSVPPFVQRIGSVFSVVYPERATVTTEDLADAYWRNGLPRDVVREQRATIAGDEYLIRITDKSQVWIQGAEWKLCGEVNWAAGVPVTIAAANEMASAFVLAAIAADAAGK